MASSTILSPKLLIHSSRVKSVDFHPTQPWVLAALYSGDIFLWDHSANCLVKSLRVADFPVRVAKFLPAKEWIVVGSDDFFIRIFSAKTFELIHLFLAHNDYLRSLIIHPTLPYLLSCSDDSFIKCWNYEQNFKLLRTFSGHAHFCMQIALNPSDSNSFASAALDGTVKIWNLAQESPINTLKCAENNIGLAALCYLSAESGLLAAGGDDSFIRIYNYHNSQCVAKLAAHNNSITALFYYENLNLLLSTAEDQQIMLWECQNFALQNTKNFQLQRGWAICSENQGKVLAIGYDNGLLLAEINAEALKTVQTQEFYEKLVDVMIITNTKGEIYLEIIEISHFFPEDYINSAEKSMQHSLESTLDGEFRVTVNKPAEKEQKSEEKPKRLAGFEGISQGNYIPAEAKQEDSDSIINNWILLIIQQFPAVSAAVPANSDSRDIELLLLLMRLHKSNENFIETAAAVMKNLPTIKLSSAQKIAGLNCTDLLLQLVTEYIDCHEIIKYLSSPLANSIENQQQIEWRERSGLLGMLLLLIKHYSGDCDIITNAARGLFRLLQRNKANSQQFIKASGLELLIRALRDNFYNFLLINPILNILVTLGYELPETRTKMNELGAVELLISATREHINRPTVIEPAVRLFVILALDSELRTVIGKAGGVELLLFVAQIYSEEKGISKFLGDALAMLAFNGENKAKIKQLKGEKHMSSNCTLM
jgi:coatomer subunit beta'